MAPATFTSSFLFYCFNTTSHSTLALRKQTGTLCSCTYQAVSMGVTLKQRESMYSRFYPHLAGKQRAATKTVMQLKKKIPLNCLIPQKTLKWWASNKQQTTAYYLVFIRLCAPWAQRDVHWSVTAGVLVSSDDRWRACKWPLQQRSHRTWP